MIDLTQASKNIRTTVLRMICKSKSSHIWWAFSIADIMTYLYIKKLNEWDKVLLSKWHAWSVLYASLAEIWKIDKEKLINTYCTNWQKLWWHVTLWSIPWVEITAWSLGHWLSIWIWMALWIKNKNIYVILWDWEINEWSIWEWFLFAQQKKLNNLIFNGLSNDKPNLIIADTIKWKWVDFIEDKLEFHYRSPNEEEFKKALLQINN